MANNILGWHYHNFPLIRCRMTLRAVDVVGFMFIPVVHILSEPFDHSDFLVLVAVFLAALHQIFHPIDDSYFCNNTIELINLPKACLVSRYKYIVSSKCCKRFNNFVQFNRYISQLILVNYTFILLSKNFEPQILRFIINL